MLTLIRRLFLSHFLLLENIINNIERKNIKFKISRHFFNSFNIWNSRFFLRLNLWMNFMKLSSRIKLFVFTLNWIWNYQNKTVIGNDFARVFQEKFWFFVRHWQILWIKDFVLLLQGTFHKASWTPKPSNIWSLHPSTPKGANTF